ncbi:hypothetical protein ACWGE0_28315 [Lentzea sp. NPDC054927]
MWCPSRFRRGPTRSCDRAKAVAESRAALRKFQDLGERWGAAQVLDVLANLTEDPHEALALTDQALRAVSELGANEELAEMRCRRADRLLDLDQDEAERDYHQALELASRAGVTATRALATAGLARIAHRRGNLAEAEQLLREAQGELGFGWMHSTAKEQVEAVLTELVRSREA